MIVYQYPPNAVAVTFPPGSATSANQTLEITALNSLLTELQLKADLTETQPVSLASIGGIATAANQVVDQGLVGSLTETAPATDTASSGLNGRLQRIAQRLTSLIALIPTSLGQKVMASSLAVTVASDQSSLPVAADSLTVSGSATALNQDLAPSIDVGKYGNISIMLTGTWTGSVAIQGSNDNTNFTTVFIQPISAVTNLPQSVATVNGFYSCPIRFKYARVRVISGPTGTVVCSTGYTQGTSPIEIQYVTVAGTVPLPTGAATEATLLAQSAKLPATLGQKAMTASMAVVLASDQTSIPVAGTFYQATQPVSATSLPLPSGASTEATLLAEATLIGAVTETAPASDTASSGLNGRLQRIAQRLTSIVALLPASIGQKLVTTSLAVVPASDYVPPAEAVPAVLTVKNATVTAGLAAIRCTTDGSAVSATRRKLRVFADPDTVTGNAKFYIGNASVTISGATKGEQLFPGVTLALDNDANEYYIISDVASQPVSVIEVE